MGVESANYSVHVGKDLSRVDDVLRSLGAVRCHPESSNSFEKWILKDDHYWIDVMAGDIGVNGHPAISIRVAVCNPRQVESVLRQLLMDMLTKFGGRLYDGQTRRSYSDLDEATWKEVQDGYAAKREQFRRHFGTFEAAISGDCVFTALNERSE